MKNLKAAIHSALRDDAVATIGMRALLGHSATPYGVYQGFPQEPLNFKSGKSLLTWQYLAGVGTGNGQQDLRLREQLFAVTGWCPDPDKLEDVMARARVILDNNAGVTPPGDNSGLELHKIMYQDAGPDLFDDRDKVYYRAETYRAYYLELPVGTTDIAIPTSGLLSQRPAASLGTYYYSTDTGILEFSDGTTWHPFLMG